MTSMLPRKEAVDKCSAQTQKLYRSKLSESERTLTAAKGTRCLETRVLIISVSEQRCHGGCLLWVEVS